MPVVVIVPRRASQSQFRHFKMYMLHLRQGLHSVPPLFHPIDASVPGQTGMFNNNRQVRIQRTNIRRLGQMPERHTQVPGKTILTQQPKTFSPGHILHADRLAA
ncbi:uncharacterized protein METZ01_LOCUS321236, partial [marine metagenome]